MKKSYINKVSKKQADELARRRKLKRELISEYGEVCMTCGISPHFPPISLSHILPLSRGGKTCEGNCILECERLQGFPDGWTEGISDTQRYKCLGNAVTVNVIEAIGRTFD